MRILWITNIMLPPICEAMKLKTPAVGGWMYSSLYRLKSKSENEFAVATVYSGKELICKEVDGIRYYLLPHEKRNKTKYYAPLEKYWVDIKAEFKPDLVHIHGSEYPYGLAYVNACGTQNVAVSIQGIISCYARYYASGIEFTDVNFTFRDLVKMDTLRMQTKKFHKRGILEVELLKKVSHIIGRTEWDKSHTWAVNPDAAYYHCGETLRDEFYKHTWSYDSCEPHSIFVSQAGYPIKGLHKLVEALPYVAREYPDVKVYVAGGDIINVPWYRILGYGQYIKRLLRKTGMIEHVRFTGMLNEQQMCERYLKSNLFVCPSSIENSPNSLGEAQLLQMPHLSTFCGGTPQITNMNPDVLYRFEEHEMLAKKICDIFAQGSSFKPAEYNREMYDADINAQTLLSIYNKIALI